MADAFGNAPGPYSPPLVLETPIELPWIRTPFTPVRAIGMPWLEQKPPSMMAAEFPEIALD